MMLQELGFNSSAKLSHTLQRSTLPWPVVFAVYPFKVYIINYWLEFKGWTIIVCVNPECGRDNG